MRDYFDVTELLGLGLSSGIQRVVREVTTRAMVAPLGDREVVPVVARGGRFYPLSDSGRAILSGAAPAAESAPRPGAPYPAHALKALLQKIPPLHAFAQTLNFRRRLAGPYASLYERSPIVPGRRDRIVLIDSFWGGSTAPAAAASARRAGARAAVVIYDLIPVNHPQYVSRQLAYAFPRAVRRALSLADGIITISRQSTREVMEFLGTRDAPPITHFYLGCDAGATPTAVAPAAELPEPLTMGDGIIYLMVGTIEPRKGHACVLDAFESLWAAGGHQKLVVIGKVGWRMEAFMARCAAHAMRDSRLFLIHDASDAVLARAIAAADAMIMASSLEGFGLPLVEALTAGLPVLASDIPVFREIADEAATFFPCGDALALAEAITAFEHDIPRHVAAARAFYWIDWEQATGQFQAALDRVLPPDAITGIARPRAEA